MTMDAIVGRLTDRAVMDQAAAGVTEAFAELFERYANRIRRLASLMLHCEHAADDAVQETFTKALEKIADYRGEAEPATWIYSIALNVCRRTLRQSQVREVPASPSTVNEGRPLVPAPRGVFTSVAHRDLSAKLAIGVGFLSDDQREVFVLHYVEGLPYERIAAILGIGLNTALSLGYRARHHLVERMPSLAKDFAEDQD